MHMFCEHGLVSKLCLKTHLIKSYSPKLCIKIICISFDILKMKSCENLSFSKKKTTDGSIKKGLRMYYKQESSIAELVNTVISMLGNFQWSWLLGGYPKNSDDYPNTRESS
jgi:hypothetical protein